MNRIDLDPTCTDAVVAAYVRRLDDAMPDAQRQRLRQYVPLLAGTATADRTVRVRRAFLCADRAVRVFVPIALAAIGRAKAAGNLAALPPVVDRDSAMRAVSRTRNDAGSAYAYTAAWYAARATDDADHAADAAVTAGYAAADAVVDAATYVARAAAAGAGYADAGANGVWDEAIRLLDDLIAVGREEES